MRTPRSERTSGQRTPYTAIANVGFSSRRRARRPLTFLAGFVAALVLTGGGAAAWAANGGSLLIGRSNFGSATTTLSNSGGTALKLNSKAGTAPLAVNRTAKVANLNADLLDGLSEASYALAAGRSGVIWADSEWIDVDPDTPGDDALFAVAQCPAGTRLTGGGVDNFTGYPTVINSPDAAGAWFGSSFADPGVHVASDLTAYVVCYNPRGAVPGAMTPDATRSLSDATVRERLARMHSKP